MARRRRRPQSLIASIIAGFGGVRPASRVLGFTPAYISQLQTQQRPLTSAVAARIATALEQRRSGDIPA